MKKLFTFFFIVTICTCKTNNTVAQVNINDSLALVDFYNSTDGPHWYNNTNWLTGPVKTWFGIYVENNRVAQFYFPYDINLNGTLPASLGNLSELYTFVIAGNSKITGTIPSSFLNLFKLATFILDDCHVSSPIPAFDSNFSALSLIEMRNDYLTGSIPSSLGYASNLAYILLDNNQLTGNIPASFSNLTKLRILGVSNNQLTGQVPTLTNTTTITDLFLSYNQLTGPFPDFHTSNWFSELYFDHNQFSGEIPAWLSTKPIDALKLDNNRFTGISNAIANFNQYIYLAVEKNYLNFDSLEYIIGNSVHNYFSYAPQLNIPVSFSSQGTYGKLSVHAGGTLSKNTYQWYRNNSLYKVNVGDSTLLLDTTGVYFVKVNNTVVTALQLISDSIVITQCIAAKPTIATNKSLVNICPKDSVMLTASDAAAYIWNTGATTKNIIVKSAGNYTVSVTDVNGCKNTSDTAKATYRPCVKPTGLSTPSITATSARLSWSAVTCAVGYQYEWKKKATPTWSTAQTTGVNRTIRGLTPNTTYQWRVITACKVSPDTITSAGYTNGPEFTTLTLLAQESIAAASVTKIGLQAKVSPNPVTNVAYVSIIGAIGKVEVTLSDISGKQLWQSGKITATNISVPIQNLAAGTYVVRVEDQKQTVVLKTVKE